MVICSRLSKSIITHGFTREPCAKAKELAELFGMKYYVINLGATLKVVPKQTVKELVRRGRFRKGVTVEDIEKHALFRNNLTSASCLSPTTTTPWS